MWHASIARLNSTGVVYLDRWGDGMKREARRRLERALSGVGRGESVELVNPSCIHLRRSLTDEEMAMLSAEWLAIPARDEFGPGGAMEMRL